MRVLALDTTSAYGSLAIAEDNEVIEEVTLHSPDGFGHVLFDHIRRLLNRHEWDVNSIRCFAAAAGPGSFTGVRVGLTAAKGLAEAAGGIAVGVSNLQALAAHGTTPLRAVVMDARRGEVYGAVYDSALQVVCPEIVVPFQRWVDSLPSAITEVISPDFSPFRGSFHREAHVIEQRVLAGAIGRIAVARLQAGEEPDAAAVDANYVRHSDAELNWKDR